MKRSYNFMSRAYVFPHAELPLGVKVITSQGEYDFHRHEDYVELVIVASGHATHIVENQQYPIGPGHVFVILGEREHAYCHVDGLVLYNVLFDNHQFQFPFHDLVNCTGFQVLFNIDPKSSSENRFKNRFLLDYPQLCQAKELIDKLEQGLQEKKVGYQFFAISLFLELIGFLVQSYSANCQVQHLQSVPHRLGGLVAFMEKHYSEPITVAMMCRRSNLSRSNLFRQFRYYLKKTPIEQLLDIRLRHAKELLVQSDRNISEIAWRCGFNDSNYFARQFRNCCQTTPMRFRRDFRNL